MSGLRPFQVISAIIFPTASLIFVCLLSQLVASSDVEGSLCCCIGKRDLEEEAKAFDDNDRGLTFDEDEKDSGMLVEAIRTVTISYTLPPVATSTREVLSISASVNLSSILVGESCDGVNEVIYSEETTIPDQAQTGGGFMISKLGISFVLGYF